MAINVEIEFLETDGRDSYSGFKSQRCADYVDAELYWVMWQRMNPALLVVEQRMVEVD